MKKRVLIPIVFILLIVIGITSYFLFFHKAELETEYLTIEGGNYKSSELPLLEEAPDLVKDLRLNKTVITGGSNIINFSSATLLKQIMVGINGVKGYIDVPLEAVFDQAKNLYHYTVLLSLSQRLERDFHLDLVVKSEDGALSKPYSTDVSTIKAGTGALQISLSWDLNDDLDLHVFEPDGDEVYFGAPVSFPQDMDLNKFYFDRNVWVVKKHNPDNDEEYTQSFLSKMKLKLHLFKLFDINMKKETSLYMKEKEIAYCGELDIDSNPACNIDGIRNENVFYIKPEPGTYTVKVDLFARCESVLGVNGAKYSVTVKYGNKDMKLDSGQSNLIGQIPETMKKNSNKEAGLIEICTFTIPGEVKKPAQKQKVDKDMSVYFDKLFNLLQ